jgi:hypothetical protein
MQRTRLMPRQIRDRGAEHRAGREQEAQVEADFFRQVERNRWSPHSPKTHARARPCLIEPRLQRRLRPACATRVRKRVGMLRTLLGLGRIGKRSGQARWR